MFCSVDKSFQNPKILSFHEDVKMFKFGVFW